jgi:hypothetical protein
LLYLTAHNATQAAKSPRNNNNNSNSNSNTNNNNNNTRYGSLQRRVAVGRAERAAHETHRRFRSWAAPALSGSPSRPLPASYTGAPSPLDARRPRASTASSSFDARAAAAHHQPGPPTLTRRSSLEQLAELEAFVESKQRELTQVTKQNSARCGGKQKALVVANPYDDVL